MLCAVDSWNAILAALGFVIIVAVFCVGVDMAYVVVVAVDDCDYWCGSLWWWCGYCLWAG